MYLNLPFVFVFICSSYFLNAQSYFEYDQQLTQIYNKAVGLEIDAARLSIRNYQKENPDNLSALHIENYIDFFEIFISEEKELFEELLPNKKLRIERIQNEAESNDPYTKFTIAEIELQWALMRSKFGQLFRAGKELLNAYKILENNHSKHPDFIYNNKSLSIIHALIETISIPGFVKNLFGIKGSIDQGISEIKALIQYCEDNDAIFLKEAKVIYSYILFYQKNEKDRAWNYLIQSNLDPSESPLLLFVMTNLAQRSGRNEQALSLLNSLDQNDESKSEFAYLHFLKGLSKLRALETDADIHFKKYLDTFKGRHYIKESYQKLGWYELVINDDKTAYKNYMRAVLDNGVALIDDDKQAHAAAENKIIPNRILLKARLLYDGGYYQKAYNLLILSSNEFSRTHPEYLEYNYRLARITHALKNYPDALVYYSVTVSEGFFEPSHFACNAALNMGLIYESQNETKKAFKYYKKCLDISPTNYKSSLHQKAKSGLNRLK